jgi:hypothetical protein
MSRLKVLSWENFLKTVLIRGQQRLHRVSEKPLIEIFSDAESGRLGVWIETPQGTEIPPDLQSLELIRTSVLEKHGRPVLEVFTTAPRLHRHFYYFAMTVAERIVGEQLSSVGAVRAELGSFSDLLEVRALLSPERQTGLVGELLFLEHLVDRRGIAASDAWIAPREPRDFRLGRHEFEVKTTVTARRIHTIHGLEQLVPSEGCSLFVVSILLGPPGSAEGFTLPELVNKLRLALAADTQRSEVLNSTLKGSGYRNEDAIHYSKRYVLRRPLALVPVNEQFPAITRPSVQTALGALASRIESVQYEVNVEGLEHEPGSAVYESALEAA